MTRYSSELEIHPSNSGDFRLCLLSLGTGDGTGAVYLGRSGLFFAPGVVCLVCLDGRKRAVASVSFFVKES